MRVESGWLEEGAACVQGQSCYMCYVCVNVRVRGIYVCMCVCALHGNYPNGFAAAAAAVVATVLLFTVSEGGVGRVDGVDGVGVLLLLVLMVLVVHSVRWVRQHIASCPWQARN